MHCSEFNQDLMIAWEGRPALAKVADHLATCPRCSAMFEETRQLARLWEATRPASPAEADWDAAWTRVGREVEASSLPIAKGSRSGGRHRVAYVPIGITLAAAASLLLALVLPRWGGPRDLPAVAQVEPPTESLPERLDQPVPFQGILDVQPGQIALYSVDRDLKSLIEEPDVFDEFLAFHGHVETLDRGNPIRWFIDVNPGQTVLYSVDRDVLTVVDEPDVDVFAWIPDVEDEFYAALYAVAECEFRFGVLALNGDPTPSPFAH
ncbi:hypothetical protein BH23PLA1_BH23PLA1_08750 [soil metagenome]